MSNIAMSFLWVNSSNAFSMVLVSVSLVSLSREFELLASTIRKFFVWSWVICPIPASKRPVTESYLLMRIINWTPHRRWRPESFCLCRAEMPTLVAAIYICWQAMPSKSRIHKPLPDWLLSSLLTQRNFLSQFGRDTRWRRDATQLQWCWEKQ